jgi:hypothetical protein
MESQVDQDVKFLKELEMENLNLEQELIML